MKNFKQFLTEADIRKNPAMSPEYLASLNRRAEQATQEIERRYGMDMANFMRYVHEVQGIQSGKEGELEGLATEIILDQFGPILGNTVLDIKFPENQAEVKKIMKGKPEQPEIPTYKDIEDEQTISAIHKRKIMNMITQGEAINTKWLLAGDQASEGLAQILGEDKAARMIELLMKITDFASARDWRIPEEVGARMIEMGDSISGVSKIEWKPEEPSEENDEETNDEETGGEEQTAENTVPHLIVRGADFAMLLHEAVKGIYGLINQGGLAHLDDETIAKVFMNTDTPRDEVQDLKRAKLTAADLRDFIKTFPEVNEIANGQEYVWGKMIDASLVPDTEFLNLMRLIGLCAPLYRTQGQGEPAYSEAEMAAAREAMPKATAIVQKLVKMVKDELDAWEAQSRAAEIGDEEETDTYSDLGLTKPARAESFDLDDILDKISASGMDSLTDAEREFLRSQS
mgnify:CR=1 FL=1